MKKLLILLLILLTTPAYAIYQNVYNPFTGKMDRVQDISTDTPLSVSTACEPVEFAYDGGYFYVCVDTNSWKRVALTTWSITDLLLMSDGVSNIVLDDGTSKILIRP